MLEIDGVVDAYFEDRVEVLVTGRSPERLARIEAVLAEHQPGSPATAAGAP